MRDWEAGQNLIGKRDHQAVCRAGLEKDVYERYLLVLKSGKFEKQ
jgi:hypothetical protein